MTRIPEPSNNSFSSSNVHQTGAKPNDIYGQDPILTVAFLVDGKHVVSGSEQGKIRRWRIEDGREVGAPMDAGSAVHNIAVSRDGKWVVSGTTRGLVAVWDAESGEKKTEFQGHTDFVRAIDVSPDATKIASGSADKTACVWSLSTGERLLNPFKYDDWVVVVKFSPDGRLIVTATWGRDSVRVYDSQNGRLLVEFPVQVYSAINQSLAWASDSEQLFALSRDGNIHSLGVSTGTTLSQWPTNSSKDTQCRVALASNGAFIATSTFSSVSFWDTTTHIKIDSAIHHTAGISSMAISSNHDLMIAGGDKITVRNLRDVLPSRYCDDVSACVSNVHCVIWPPNVKLILTATADP